MSLERLCSQPSIDIDQRFSGFGAKVYIKELANGQKVAKKIFDPNLTARLTYGAFRFKVHPFLAPYSEFVIKGAFELRRVAHRVSKALNYGAEVVDAIGLCESELGFYSPYISEATKYSTRDETIKGFVNRLEGFFDLIGLPTASFGSYFKETRRKSNVLVGSNRIAYIVDYEVACPDWNPRYLIGFDDVDIHRFQGFLDSNGEILAKRLGETEYSHLKVSWQNYISYNDYWRGQEQTPLIKIQAIYRTLLLNGNRDIPRIA